MRGDIEPETIDAILGIAVSIGVEPPAGDVKNMRLHLRLQIALEGVAFPFAHHVYLFEFRQSLDAQPTLVAKFILRRLRIIE